jgi:hypothetical protein
MAATIYRDKVELVTVAWSCTPTTGSSLTNGCFSVTYSLSKYPFPKTMFYAVFDTFFGYFIR